MLGSANKILTEAVTRLIQDGLLILPSFGWVDVEKWIDKNYPKSFLEPGGRNYYEYIQSDDWRKERERQFSIHGRVCEICGSSHDLQVHHISYENGEHPTEYDCAVLCRGCHERLHICVEQMKADVDIERTNERKWRSDVGICLGHKFAKYINYEWPWGIPGMRKVRAVSIIRATLQSQVNMNFLVNHQTITHDLIKGGK